MKKFSKFFKNFQVEYITKIFNSKKINDSKTKNLISINKDEFIKNINDIPLKFINYKIESENRFFSLLYAFDYVKYPLENEINNYIAINRFNTENAEGSLKGGEFENIIFHKFILDKPLFDIDGFIIVNKIINMELENEYKNIHIKELQGKNCIFISQIIYQGEDYDFAILYPIKKEIILIQARYKITRKNIKYKSYYSDINKVNIIMNSISSKFKIAIDKVYVLYLSSLEYNYDHRNDVQKLLNSYKINCIFYSVKKDYFTSNFHNILNNNFIPNQSMEIFPISSIYIEQNIKIRNKIEDELLFFIKDNQNTDIKNRFILEQYNEFIKYLDKSKISKEVKNCLGKFETIFINDYNNIPKSIL